MAVCINALKVALVVVALAMSVCGLIVSSPSTASAAQQSAVPVAGGKSTLKLNDRMIRKLKQAKVTVKPTGSAKGGMRKLVFPVTGGRVGISEGKLAGVARHRGSGLRMGKSTPPLFEKKDLAFRNPVVDLSRNRLGYIEQDNLYSYHFSLVVENDETHWVGRDGFRARVELTRRGAKLLRSRLGFKVKKGTTFGTWAMPQVPFAGDIEGFAVEAGGIDN